MILVSCDSRLPMVKNMPKSIRFFPTTPPHWQFDREAILFVAIVDGTPVRCYITLEALKDLFGSGSTRESALSTFEANREAIQQLAREMLETGKVNNKGDVTIRKPLESFEAQTNPITTYHFGVGEDGELRILLNGATQLLAQIIARAQVDVYADWEVLPSGDLSIYQLTLEDKSDGVKLYEWFSLPQLRDKVALRQRLDRVWAEFLQVQNHRQLLQMQTA